MYDFGWDIEEGLPNVKPFRELRIKMASCFNMDDLKMLTLDLDVFGKIEVSQTAA